MHKAGHGRAWLLIGLVAACLAVAAPILGDDRAEPARGRQGMVVSASAPASAVGVEVLKRRGNAVDAAVATAFALAVTYPSAGNIGGGGFMTIYPPPESGRGGPAVVDYRETAPAAADARMFATGAEPGLKIVGVPGTVDGLATAHGRYGILPWRELIEPAEALARDGFAVEPETAGLLNGTLVGGSPELRRVFGKPDASPWRAGDLLVQPDLARTLRAIADGGPGAFYRGPIADLLLAEVEAGGGLITRDDLAGYRSRVTTPAHGTYRGYDIYTTPPPGGGVTVVEILNILEGFDLRSKGRWSTEAMHLMIEAMRRAYRDRALFVGDPQFTNVPARLTSKDYARELARTIDAGRASSSEGLAAGMRLSEGGDTTHFSVVDREGMAVANTYTLEQEFGSRVVVRGAGFLLNNEMGDFNRRPGLTDRRGAIGTGPNLVAPGKRMLSAQAPTIVARDGRAVLVTGSPGGRTIINTVAQVILNVLEFDMEIGAAVAAPRMHHAWFPDRVSFEAGAHETHADALRHLQAKGHLIDRLRAPRQGAAHSIWIGPDGWYSGVSDRRRGGAAIGY